MTIDLGRFTAGERPAPLRYTFEDATGAPLDLTGYTATFTRAVRGDFTTAAATIPDPEQGAVEYEWAADDLAAPGLHKGEFFVTNGTNTYASERLVWLVRRAVAAS
jgi:hypothetical protein